ncbi:hypothetical protein ACO1PF_10425 [Alkalibacterium sp. f15]|uniref:hypothetical protein n=1 Tax=Alkalibacterium sp. f15 TaxID=3414029 RepID=UPI003BF8C442
MLNKKYTLGALVVLTILSSCSADSSSDYNKAIETGLDYIIAEDYSRAEVQFEQAIAFREGDDRAAALLAQTTHYSNAQKLLTDENMDEAIQEIKKISTYEDGSSGFIMKSERLLAQIDEEKNIVNDSDTEKSSESDNNTENNNEEVAATNDSTDSESEINDSTIEEEKTKEITKDDFKGFYAAFEDAPFNSNIFHVFVITDSVYHDIVPAWGEYGSFHITHQVVSDNKLSIDYEPRDEEGGMELTAGSKEFQLTINDDQSKVIHSGDYQYYPISIIQLNDFGFDLKEISLDD